MPNRVTRPEIVATLCLVTTMSTNTSLAISTTTGYATIRSAAVPYDGRGTRKLTRSVLKRTEELRGHPPVDVEGALSASAHSEVVAPRAGRGGTTSSNPLCSSRQSVSAVNPEAVGEKPRTLAAVCGWLGT